MKSRSSIALAMTLALAACAGNRTPPRTRQVLVGRPYVVGGRTYVPRDDRHYDVVGLASWYGAGHAGKPTASGERFDPEALTAAHTTLPIPSWVEVTVLATGRSLVLRINDRGPFRPERIIDLSHGAARRLGVERAGVAKVRVRRVARP
jgi:rare lipoprotein A